MTFPPQEEFCHVDQWAAEAYLTALDAQDMTYLTLLDKGIKIHKWFLERTKERWPDEVAAAGYGYDEAKQNVHSLNYGAMPPKMSRSSKLPLHVSQWQWDFYHTTFPGIQRRQLRIEDELKRTKRLTSILGRHRIFLMPMGDKLLNEGYAWPSQSCIGELTNIALTRIYYFGRVLKNPWMFPSLNTHDGIVIRVPVGCRDGVKNRIRQAFYIPLAKDGMTICIPIEIGWGRSFNEVTDKEILRYPNGNSKPEFSG